MEVHKVEISPRIKPYVFTSHVKDIFSIFRAYGYSIRIVGGAVRDILMDKLPRDVDLATKAEPVEIIYLLNELAGRNPDIKVNVRGIPHGTVKIEYSENEIYEITSLVFRVTEKDKSLEITKEDTWRKDAFSRDFTINALQLVDNGFVFDYVKGVNDLKNQRVKFIRDFKEVMTESPVVIYRFFKTMAMFSKLVIDVSILEFIQNNTYLTQKVGIRTKQWFLENIAKQPNGEQIINLMQQYKII
jgi:tRNA nucleotidyltransferase (CCA-adding enzyme)